MPTPSLAPRPLHPHPLGRTAVFYTLACLLCLLAWDFSGLDRQVMHWVGHAQGFAWRESALLEQIFHTGARRLAAVIYLGVLAMVYWPRGIFRNLARWQRLEIAVGIALALVAISGLKSLSLTSCPWDLQDFGGPAMYVSHWQWGVPDGGSGRCFPGGHASSAMAFLALSLPWLSAASPAQRRIGKVLLLTVLFLGLLLGMVQTLRGAHYPSHTFWTGFICWLVVWANHSAFGQWAQRQSAHHRV